MFKALNHVTHSEEHNLVYESRELSPIQLSEVESVQDFNFSLLSYSIFIHVYFFQLALLNDVPTKHYSNI